MTTTAYEAMYSKKDGSQRQIRFVKVGDLPANVLTENVKGTGKTRTLTNGMELVWDIDSKGFRTFNWNTVSGDV